ncbi:MAG: DUF3299 domain-containing protein [Planctomycetota bacterium]
MKHLLHTIFCAAALTATSFAQEPTPEPPPEPILEEPVLEEPVVEEPVVQEPAVEEEERVEPEVTEVDLPEDSPIPAGSDPADLRAMRSAREMMVAERRLRSLIKNGEIEGIDRLVTFEELSSWPYEDGLKGIPKAIEKLDGQQVAMIGFMLPIDEVEDIKEFLLVQSLWACCFGTPPDINGLVRVVMQGDRRVDYQFDPILVQGTFRVEATREEGYCLDIYQLHASSVKLVEDARKPKEEREKPAPKEEGEKKEGEQESEAPESGRGNSPDRRES